MLALKRARAEQQARARFGLGEICLLEDRCDQARAEFTRAGELASQPGWAATVQLALAHAWAQERNSVAARAVLVKVRAVANLDRSLVFRARMLSEALEVGPRVRPDHPRLFFNADTWPGPRSGF